MDLLQNILGGGQQRQQFQDFANRYQQGAPYDGISEQEALQHYRQVAPHLSPQQWQESAQESFSRLAPQQRMELGRYLMQGAQQQGYAFPDVNRDGIDDRMQDPRYLAQVAGQMRQQQPGLFSQLLGGAMGGGAMGGGSGLMGGGGAGGNLGQMLNNPIAKAALAGIAATAMQRMMSGR
ncbi:MAG: hypothetical protein CYG59_10410 [Chloroflexi bacterium]|nr:MAG: hypothetical protein CYG59_10410 [Chloroflexota bacterium]